MDQSHKAIWDEIKAIAKKAGAKHPSLLAAQFVLESGFGKHVSGRHNYFGLKGLGTTKKTSEFVDGKEIFVNASFLDFDSKEQCIQYIIDRWYKDWKGYKGCNNASDRNAAAKWLQKEGYATNPLYAKRLIDLMNEYDPIIKTPTIASQTNDPEEKKLRLADAARFNRGLPWQLFAWSWLFEHAPASSWDTMQEAIPPEIMEEFSNRFRNLHNTPTIADPKTTEKPKGHLILKDIPRFTQRDSQWLTERDSTCYSSTNAMLVEYLKPGTLKGRNGDDLYLKRLKELGGSSTDWIAQQKTLDSFGLKATLIQNGNWDLIERQLKAGRPVPLGYLHRGPAWAPKGGGHWCLCYGIDATHIWISDPWGEPDLVNGTTLSQGNWQGKVTKVNFGKRWMVKLIGSGVYTFEANKGWAVIIDD